MRKIALAYLLLVSTVLTIQAIVTKFSDEYGSIETIARYWGSLTISFVLFVGAMIIVFCSKPKSNAKKPKNDK